MINRRRHHVAEAERSGGAVERWSGGAVKRWSGGAVERWSGGEWGGGVIEDGGQGDKQRLYYLVRDRRTRHATRSRQYSSSTDFLYLEIRVVGQRLVPQRRPQEGGLRLPEVAVILLVLERVLTVHRLACNNDDRASARDRARCPAHRTRVRPGHDTDSINVCVHSYRERTAHTFARLGNIMI